LGQVPLLLQGFEHRSIGAEPPGLRPDFIDAGATIATIARCDRTCVLLSGHAESIRHYCGEDSCTALCSVPHCGRPCAHDHWHTVDPHATHDCGFSDHTCSRLRKLTCAACGAPCALSGAVPHDKHMCADAESKPCVFRCWVPGCERACQSRDHFHGFSRSGDVDGR